MLRERFLTGTAVWLVLVGIALFATKTECEDHSNKLVDRQLTILFKDKDLRAKISRYLDIVPSSHKSRSHAVRSGATKSYKNRSKDGKNTNKKRSSAQRKSGKSTPVQANRADAYDNNVKDVLSIIMSSGPKDCKPCDPCTNQPDCAPCVEVHCDKCPPCPITSRCPPPKQGEKCPPKPVCKKCPGASGATTKESDGLSTSKTASTSKKPSPTNAIKRSGKTASKNPKSNTSGPHKKRPALSRRSVDPRKKAPPRNAATGTTKGGKNIAAKSATHQAHITSEMLFEKNLNELVQDKTVRKNILKMLDEIPESAGGEEMQLASIILARLGAKPTEPIKKDGNSRSFTYMTARNNLREILGHILSRFLRNKCHCPECKLSNTCKCKPKPACPPMKSSSCPPCNVHGPPKCLAAAGCTEHPPCKDCKIAKLGDIDYDGDPEDLDDVDPANILKGGELEKGVQCKGYTCAFQSTCGKADLNRLTPKGSQSGYIVGGADQIYGEWPQFVKVQIDVDETGFYGYCGGVLISDMHVLTAGHCLVDPESDQKITSKSLNVILAEHDKKKKDKFEDTRKVASVCYSSKYSDPNQSGSRYDFGVLTLDKKVKFNDHIQPACLPYKPLPDKAKCFVVGMGATQHSIDAPVILASIVQKLPIGRASCESWGFKHDDRSRHCFAKADGNGDSCGGDSGGPVLCLSKFNRWTIGGLVSYGSEHCDGTESTGWVAVYTRIPALLKQINQDCKI